MPLHVIRTRVLLPLVLLVGCTDPPSQEATATAEVRAEPTVEVEVVRTVPYAGLGSDEFARQHYRDVRATISGTFTRKWDRSTGSYKVPLRLIYPDFCVSSAVVEALHPNLVGEPVEDWADFHIPGQSDPDFDPLFDLTFNEAFSNLGARGLFGGPPEGGHVYAGVLVENFTFPDWPGVLNIIAAVPENQSLGLHLERPTDLAFVYAGISQWLRQDREGDLGGHPGPCAVDTVVAFGYSYTSFLARSFLASGLNTDLAAKGRGHQLVFDGTLLAGDSSGGGCYDLRTDPVEFVSCEGATPRQQGPVISVRSDGDVELFAADLVVGRKQDDHYIVHHVAGGAHLDEDEFSYQAYEAFLGVEIPNRQNTIDRDIVLRADLRNLIRWIERGVRPPETTLNVGTWMEAELLSIVALDPVTGNTIGGVQLPALAAPLGLYRGSECHGVRDGDIDNAYLWAEPPLGSGDLQSGHANYLLEPSEGVYGLYCFDAGTQGFFGGWELMSGVFLPYTSIPGSTHCAQLYPSRAAYTERVMRSVEELVSAGFLLEDEADDVTAAAEAAADEHPGCVPGL